MPAIITGETTVNDTVNVHLKVMYHPNLKFMVKVFFRDMLLLYFHFYVYVDIFVEALLRVFRDKKQLPRRKNSTKLGN